MKISLENEYFSWLETQRYAKSTIQHYVRLLRNCAERLYGIELLYTNLFYIDSSIVFKKVKDKILSADNFNEINKRYGNNGFRSSMDKYEQFLIDREGKDAATDNVIVNEKSNREIGMDKNESILKNIILYGPPGTGKTYNTVNYAVSIIEDKNIDDIKTEKYKDVFERYKIYKEDGQVVFTTFHQSYGYEEFIEGIRPVVEENEQESSGGNIQYEIENGVFKQVCNIASRKEIKTSSEVNPNIDINISPNNNIWKVTVGENNDHVKKYCFDNKCVCIGWEKGEDSSNTYKHIIRTFKEDIKKGDIIFSGHDSKYIDGIGIVTGDYEYDPNLNQYAHKRSVKWLTPSKDTLIEVYTINGNTRLDNRVVSELKDITREDLIELLEPYCIKDNIKVEVVNNKNKYVIIIDEINRGNISRIFGELITLIEPTKRIGSEEETKVILPCSKNEFGVPNNVYILGTMNTADRSIALLDTALRRRFNFIEIMPNSHVLDEVIVEGVINISEMLEIINRRIEVLYDREHMIGHAYFMELKNNSTLDKLKEIFQNAIIPLLQEYFYEDYKKIQLVLGDNYKPEELKFIQRSKIPERLFGKENNIDIDFDNAVYKINENAFNQKEAYIAIYTY